MVSTSCSSPGFAINYQPHTLRGSATITPCVLFSSSSTYCFDASTAQELFYSPQRLVLLALFPCD